MVIGSDPLQEVEEAKWKAQAICRAAWGFSPAGETNHSPRDASSVNIHPIPPITTSVQHLIENRDSSLLPRSLPKVPKPVVWYPGLTLEATTHHRILFVDNLDSFTWNIVHAFATMGAEVIIVPGRLEVDTPSSVSYTHLTLPTKA